METRSGCLRGGAQRPHGALRGGCSAVRPALRTGPALLARGGLTSPARGRAAWPFQSRTVRRGRSDGPQVGRVSQRSGPRGAAGTGAHTGAQNGGQRPRALVNPSSAYLSVDRYVCLRPRAAEPCRAPGKASLAHLQPPPAPGKQDRGAATQVFLLGLLPAPRATAVLRGRSWEPNKEPEPLQLSPP